MSSQTEPRPTPVRNDRTHFLYLAVIVVISLSAVPLLILTNVGQN